MFYPYEWYWDERKARWWRVKAGQAERRKKLCDAMNILNDDMASRDTTFGMIDEWHTLKQAILECEEFTEFRPELESR